MMAVGALAAGCAQPTAQVIEKEVPVEKIVKETVVVEKQVPVEKVVKETVVVSKEVAIEKVVTATPVPAKYNEAPMLAELVKAGKLPPVDERLPEEPLVVEPYHEIGSYGGTLRRCHQGAADNGSNNWFLQERLARYSPEGAMIPDVAKSWSFNSDATAITINLRRGMKWSDGAPFTTNDVMFWYEDIALNKELSPSPPSWIRLGGDVGVFTKADDYTFTVSFANPYGAFETVLGSGGNGRPWDPAHYMKQFHASYADKDALAAAMKAEGTDVWTDLYGLKTVGGNSYQDAVGTPNLLAWNSINHIDEPLQIMDRNPYYWKVDTAGNQLPYIDKISRLLVPDREAIMLKAIAGEVDYQCYRLIGVHNFPMAMANREKGDYKVVLYDNPASSLSTIQLNHSNKDPILKELIGQRDFRVALSVAINRDEINQLIFDGQATLGTSLIGYGSSFWDESQSTTNAEYDPSKANALLDGLGLDKRDGEGYRLRSDGKRLSLVNLVQSTQTVARGPEVHELTKGYWKDVGIEVFPKPTAGAIWTQQVLALDHDLACNSTSFGHSTSYPLASGNFACINRSTSWAPAWGTWYASGGEEGDEPPAPVKELQRLYEAALAEPDAEKRRQLVKDALAIHAEEMYLIGMVNEPDIGRFFYVTNRMGNVPERILGENGISLHSALFYIKA